MANHSNDNIFDLILGNSDEGVVNQRSSSEELFGIINDNASIKKVSYSVRDVSVSSIEDKYSTLMDIKVINLD
jgi:hypothetical protein